jgi:peroxiredoxin
METGLSQHEKVILMPARLRYPFLTVLLLALSVLPLSATAPVPRQSPDLQFLDSSDNQIRLSSFKGKVVLIEFLLIDCPHCSRVAQMLGKLQRDLGPRGFQPIGIAFENGLSGPLVSEFVQNVKIGFPVGYTTADQVDRYLGRVGLERFSVPQIVLIDRQGIIRAQSQPIREMNLENENYLHNLVDSLLEEGVTSWLSRAGAFSPIAILIILGCIVVWKMNHK